MLGFLTPMLVDRWSRGDAGRAGRALRGECPGRTWGPLLSGFFLLPAAEGAMVAGVLGAFLYLLAFGLWPSLAIGTNGFRARTSQSSFRGAGNSGCGVVRFVDRWKRAITETLYPGAQVRRDHTATVIAAGEGMNKRLLVNGMGITNLTPHHQDDGASSTGIPRNPAWQRAGAVLRHGAVLRSVLRCPGASQ